MRLLSTAVETLRLEGHNVLNLTPIVLQKCFPPIPLQRA